MILWQELVRASLLERTWVIRMSSKTKSVSQRDRHICRELQMDKQRTMDLLLSNFLLTSLTMFPSKFDWTFTVIASWGVHTLSAIETRIFCAFIQVWKKKIHIYRMTRTGLHCKSLVVKQFPFAGRTRRHGWGREEPYYPARYEVQK